MVITKMSEIKIKCPTCGKILRLQDSPTINTASFTCPVCKEKHVVGKCQRFVEQSKPQHHVGEETQYGSTISRMGGGEETQYADSGYSTSGEETQIYSTSQSNIGFLVDNIGRIYRLCLGINTIGRKASTSSATVQIETTDRTMSRSHAVIEVRNAGGQIMHILKNGANKNPSYHKGSIVGPSDQMILNNNDKVKFGSTELTFKK